MHYLIWTDAEAEANQKLRNLARAAKYPYIRRKLESARWHLIETHTREVAEAEWQGERVVTNGEVPA